MMITVLLDGVCRIPVDTESNRLLDINAAISQALQQSPHQFYLTQNGKLVPSSDDADGGQYLLSDVPICVHQRVFGGKGGFGSMLRAIGAQIEKTTNREACRDLSGRRLRDINEEKRLKEYLEKQKDQKDDEAAKIARKIERLRAQPKHEFSDTEYFETRSNLLDDVSNALEDGLKKAGTSTNTATATTTSGLSSGAISNRGDQDSSSSSSSDGHADASGPSTSQKRKHPEKMDKKLKLKKKKKKKTNIKGGLWFDEGLSSGDSSDDDDDDDEDDNNDNDKDAQSTNSSSKKSQQKINY